MIDANLSWKKHIECILKKIRSSVGILSKTAIKLPKKSN